MAIGTGTEDGQTLAIAIGEKNQCSKIRNYLILIL